MLLCHKDPSSHGYDSSICHVGMWKMDYKESWQPKIWCFWTVVLKKILEGRLDCQETQPLHPKGNQVWIYIANTNIEPETLILL